MFKNLFIFCFILSISFIGIHSEENEELLSKLTIIKVSGELKEHQRQQIISLSFIPPIKLNPKNLTDLELKKEGKSYNPETKCFESEVTSKGTLIKCKLDLSDISYGTYEINSFNYKKQNYLSKARIDIIKSNRKISDIKLINYRTETKIIEYQSSRQTIYIEFDSQVNYNIINFIEIQSNKRKRYFINTECHIDNNNEIYCLAYFNVKGGEYKIMSVLYGDEIIILSRDLFINIEENIAHLTKAYQYYSGDINNSKHSCIRFFFDNTIEKNYGYFTEFSFTNVKTRKIYKSYDFRRLFGSTGRGDQDDYIFDLHEIPPGDYYVGYVYKLRSYHSNVKIKIEPVQKIDLSKIYQDYDFED